MTPADAIPGAASAGTGAEPLWTPGPERIAATQIDAFRRAVGVDGGYRELHRWSVDHPVDFWQAVWNHLGVVGDPGSTVVDRDGASHLTGTRWFPDGFIASRPDVLERRRQKSLQNDPAAYAAAYRVLAESDLADEIHMITAPTLVMTGECDAGSTPRMAELLAARIPRGECVILPELKHSVLLEAADLIASELHRFLAASPD